MHLATLQITIRVAPGFRPRRKTVRMILEKIHRHFNVSVVELGGLNHLSETTIGVAALGPTRREIRETLDRVADAVAAHPRTEVIAVERTDH